jgi:hypothetical protein
MREPQDRNAAPSPTGDGDGVRIVGRGSGRAALAWKALALVLVVGSVAYLLNMHRADPPSPASDTPSAAAGDDVPATQTSGDIPVFSARRVPAPLPPASPGAHPLEGRDLSEFVPAGEAPTMAEVIEGLHEAGIRTGLGAFNPPGTSPPLVGLAVPEDFPLPEGYVRHYQATDDGQRIEPILMFSPDYQFFDAAGRPIRIPDDRVVPRELAPPGLPIRLIEIPPPQASRPTT